MPIYWINFSRLLENCSLSLKFVCLKLYKPWSKLRLQLTLKQFQILIPHFTSSHLTQLQFSLFMQTICDCREKVSVRVPTGSLLFLINFAMILPLKIPSSLAAPGVQGWWWFSRSTQLKLHHGVQSFIASLKLSETPCPKRLDSLGLLQIAVKGSQSVTSYKITFVKLWDFSGVYERT